MFPKKCESAKNDINYFMHNLSSKCKICNTSLDFNLQVVNIQAGTGQPTIIQNVPQRIITQTSGIKVTPVQGRTPVRMVSRTLNQQRIGTYNSRSVNHLHTRITLVRPLFVVSPMQSVVQRIVTTPGQANIVRGELMLILKHSSLGKYFI